MTRTRDSRSTKKPQGFSIRFNSLPKIIIPYTISLCFNNKFQRLNAHKKPQGFIYKVQIFTQTIRRFNSLSRNHLFAPISFCFNKREPEAQGPQRNLKGLFIRFNFYSKIIFISLIFLFFNDENQRLKAQYRNLKGLL